MKATPCLPGRRLSTSFPRSFPRPRRQSPPKPRSKTRILPASRTSASSPDYDPVAFDETATILEDQAFSGQLQATDPDNDALSFAVAEGGAPGSGSVVLNPDGTYTYTPDPDFHGTDSFTYVVSDGRGGTNTATVTVEVTAVPDVPFITAEPASGAEDTAIPLTVSAEVLGLEGLASVTVAGVPAGGQLSAGTDNGDGTWTLQPDELDGLNITPPPDYKGASLVWH